MNTDAEWEKWGQQDPYFGVITHERFRNNKLDETSRAEFFESGRSHVQYVWSACQRYIDPAFAPKSVLDFGCGVGRLLVPFAALAERIVGLDVSDSMLQEARRNCELFGVSNVTLAKSDDGFTSLDGRFDLIHSAIVFQHIQPERGRQLFAGLLERLVPGGIGAIQITYAKVIHAQTWGVAPPNAQPPAGSASELQAFPLRRRGIMGMLSGATASVTESPEVVIPFVEPSGADPEMQMNSYNLNHLLFILQRSGIKRFYSEFTDHGGELGVFLFFQKPHG